MANNFSSDITDMDEAASELIRYARLATEATSRFEDGVVDTGFESAVRAPLDKGEDAVIETALNRLKEEESPAYEELLSMAEDCAQTRVDAKGVHLLVLIPIMCWSRYLIPHGKISNEALKATAELFQKGWATEKATVQIGDCLLSADHLPEGLADVRHLLDRLTKKTKTGIVDIAKVVTTTPPPDFADVRYLALGVSAPDTASIDQRPYGKDAHRGIGLPPAREKARGRLHVNHRADKVVLKNLPHPQTKIHHGAGALFIRLIERMKKRRCIGSRDA